MGKAIIAVEGNETCNGCIFRRQKNGCNLIMKHQMCSEIHRKDGKNVIFKLVNLPKENKTP